MKKIGFITRNRVFALSFANLVENYPDVELEIHLLHKPEQAILDAEVLGIDIALVAVSAENPMQIEALLKICDNLGEAMPKCRKLMIVPNENSETESIAMKSFKAKRIDDYVFHDASPDYLLAKLLAL